VLTAATTTARIADSFQILLERIQPPASEAAAAASHLATIKARIESAFTLKKWVVTGSNSRGTSIAGASDVDVLAVVAREDIRHGGAYVSSYTTLDNFRKELEGRFWRSIVRRDVHAVVVEFSDCKVEVVPAFFERMVENSGRQWPVYSIPDGAGKWMSTCPDLYNAYIDGQNTASGGKLRYTAQLIKFWRECRSPRIPLSSFHIEMALAFEGICKGVKSYGECVTGILQSLAARDCRAFQDPFGISGLLPAVKTPTQRETTLASVKYSRDQAKAALFSAGLANLPEARRHWDIVFNARFPW
jgi:hypothetical protein